MTTPYLPEYSGGGQASTHDLCMLLRKRSIEPAVLAGTRTRSRVWAILRRTGSKPPVDYPVFRGRNPVRLLEHACRVFDPTVTVVVLGELVPLANQLARLGRRTVVYLRHQDWDESFGPFPAAPVPIFLANSGFVASDVLARHGIEATVIPPAVPPSRYETETSREVVTFVNPVPVKGVDTAIALAQARPDIPFEFVESWPWGWRSARRLERRVADLDNVRLLRRVADMRHVYSRTRLALIPSRWREPWGRVATEAQYSGIPVLASDIGGLPEAVGPGGILVPPDAPIAAWRDALSSVWDDHEHYRLLSDRAREYGRRPAIDVESLVTRLVDALKESAG